MGEKKNNGIRKIVEKIRRGLRLRTKAPQRFRDKTKYTRREKHPRRDDGS